MASWRKRDFMMFGDLPERALLTPGAILPPKESDVRDVVAKLDAEVKEWAAKRGLEGWEPDPDANSGEPSYAITPDLSHIVCSYRVRRPA